MKTTETPTIIGVGASAGGLEALELFLSPVPLDCNTAFVVVQHLDPIHKGFLPELLQRITPMKVIQASEGVRVKSNCVYVIPPNRDLSILHSKLHLLEPTAARGLHLPIDFFFKALAEDQGERAIGVILSGMGSDGTAGLRAIKENSGLVCVQSPESAKFDAMPRSAIDTGFADIVTTPQELWTRISSCLNHQQQPGNQVSSPVIKFQSSSGLEQILKLLRERTGNDFSYYKKTPSIAALNAESDYTNSMA